jgi:hypothetical protein
MTITEWAQFIFFGIGGAFGVLCLFDGTRRLAGGQERTRGARLAVGVGIVTVLAGYAYWQHQTYVSLARSSRMQEPVRELPADWGKKISPAKREAVSKDVARRAFIEAGTLTQYVDTSGQRRAYLPAQDDLKQREAKTAAAARIEHKAANSLSEAVLWVVLGLSAMLFGLLFAFEPKAKPADVDAEPPPA